MKRSVFIINLCVFMMLLSMPVNAEMLPLPSVDSEVETLEIAMDNPKVLEEGTSAVEKPPKPAQKPTEKAKKEVAKEAVSEQTQEQPQSIYLYDNQKMKFEVFAGGLHVVKANMELDYRDEGQYSMIFDAETRGVLGTVAPWNGSFESRGSIVENRKLVPKLHESIAMWRDEKEVKSYNFNNDGSFKDLVTLYKHKKPKTKVPDEALTKGTIDALTATMRIMEYVSDGGECDGSSEVFDGKRRYELIFRHKGFVNLKKSRHNAYSGVAAECTVEVKPISGAWHKKPRGWLSIQEQGRERGMMPTVWFAQVVKNAVVVPVRVRVKTAYGTMFMHMTRYENGSTILKTK